MAAAIFTRINRSATLLFTITLRRSDSCVGRKTARFNQSHSIIFIPLGAKKTGRVNSLRRVSSRTRGGSTHHQLGFDRNFRNVLHPSLDSVEQRTRRDLPHFLHRLSHSREWRTDVGS